MSAQACFINEGDKCSKYWFSLNKPKEPANIILGLQDEEGTVQTETRKMVGIASNEPDKNKINKKNEKAHKGKA